MKRIALDNPWSLSEKECAVLDALVEDANNKSIAKRMGLSVRTVEYHIARALVRMNAAGRVQAGIFWDRWKRGAA